MRISKKHILSFGLMVLLIFSGCVFAVPVSENDVKKADEALGLGGTLTDMVQSQFDYEMDSDGNTVDKRIEGKYSIHVFTNEEKEEVEIVKDASSFTYGNKQAGYLTLPLSYEKGDNDYTYQKIENGKTTEVTIDGYEKGDETLTEWMDFIENGLKGEGYTDITRTEEENQILLTLNPDTGVFWNIYLMENGDRIYLTEVVFVGDGEKPVLNSIIENRFFEYEAE